jgi:hypothetical protein
VPYSGIASLTFGNGVIQSFTSDTDNRITGVAASARFSATVLKRSLAWTGETLDSITAISFPGIPRPSLIRRNSRVSPILRPHRLAGAVRYCGTFAWICDAT